MPTPRRTETMIALRATTEARRIANNIRYKPLPVEPTKRSPQKRSPLPILEMECPDVWPIELAERKQKLQRIDKLLLKLLIFVATIIILAGLGAALFP